MRTFVLIVALGLVSCSTLQPFKVPTNLTETQATAQQLINEANVTLAAISNVIGQNVTDGTMTKAEAQTALDDVKRYAAQVDDAQALLRAGSPLAADRAKLVHSLILTFHKQIAAKARNP